MTDAEGAEQLRLASEVGGQIASLYDQLARFATPRSRPRELAAKAGAGSPMAAAATHA